jgi:hypothetical protein
MVEAPGAPPDAFPLTVEDVTVTVPAARFEMALADAPDVLWLSEMVVVLIVNVP